MFTILLHSSKTMRQSSPQRSRYQRPLLVTKANELGDYLKTLSFDQLTEAMKLSASMTEKTAATIDRWHTGQTDQLATIDAFLGDIYSGLQVPLLNAADRTYANEHLYILSGLYGILRALDSIMPYRLEMGYRLPDRSLYAFWGTTIASQVDPTSTIINLSAVEYTKAILPYMPAGTVVISPKFLTINKKTGEAVFVTVHAKIARGAFAHWLIVERIDAIESLKDFSRLGYSYDAERSTKHQPVFICQEFQGLGLSVRLS